ncbi:spore coat protein CotJB [Clostridiaceae bacterium NSJ-31]|uniref:Spore coat protein CotJB n=1 Tax=Ligaoa zhengdingensis TaxID=2763658 RepID=A0A926DYM5_9FIRM|nr:spore coat protein CotJB [Ligaoa zhengdingensis]MBC8546506.1 spore coat protein CotJB [Ligaoa zhengdingensis]
MTEEQRVLLNRVRVCDFVLLEAGEFLDTHPDDPAALAYFKKYNEMSQEATKEYTSKFGPLTKRDYNGGPRWDWVDGPWPWEKEGN